MELSGFYGGGGGGGGGGETDTSSLSNGEAAGKAGGGGSPYPGSGPRPSLPALKFHNHFPPDNIGSTIHDKKDALLMQVQELQGSVLQAGSVCPPQPSQQLTAQQLVGPAQPTLGNRLRMPPHVRPSDVDERVMLYVRQESEDVYMPLHVAPPTVQGLLNAVNDIRGLDFTVL